MSERLINDIIAGIVVFFVAVPLCLGVANASRAEGLPDNINATVLSGVVGGIIGGIVIGLLSNSAVSVSGPAAGLTAVVALQIGKVGSFQGFLVAVILAGLIQIIMWRLKAGSLVDFFPSSVIKGLLCAIGIILILKQLPHLFGHEKNPEGDLSYLQPDKENTLSELVATLGDIDFGATIIGLSSLLILLIWDRIPKLKKLLIPSALIVVLWGIGLYLLFQNIGGVWAMASEHRVQLPEPKTTEEFFKQFATPDFSVLTSHAVYVAAIILALVASLETLLNIEAVDKLDPKKRKTDPNRELLAQGVGNTLSGLAGGLPVTSVIVRSSANINAGAQTKLSTIIHGVLLLCCMMFIPHYLNQIPLAALAAILLVTGYKLASLKIFKQMWKTGWERFLPFLATVLAIVFTDLLIGILIGLGVAGIFILSSNLRSHSRVIQERHLSGDVTCIELGNHVSFLNRANLVRLLQAIPDGGHVLLDASLTDYIDPDIVDLIHDFAKEQAPARGIRVSLVGFKEKYRL